MNAFIGNSDMVKTGRPMNLDSIVMARRVVSSFFFFHISINNKLIFKYVD